ncbi:MAG: class I SAM-dependent methyltransferase [Flavobacteriales bacterium]
MINLVDHHTNIPLKIETTGLVGQNVFYPLLNGVFQIEKGNNYADNFGKQWKLFKKTQLDKYSNTTASLDRLKVLLGSSFDMLNDKNVLEVGCGAGRFTQILLDYSRAVIYSVDLSEAVEANYENNGPNNRLKLFRSSVYALPFEKQAFDFVFLFGVLQHTPDPGETVRSLCEMVKPGGEIIIDFYPRKGFYTLLSAKYMLRPFTKRMNPARLLRRIRRHAGWMIKFSLFLRKIKLGFLNRFIPICDIHSTLPASLTPEQRKEWVILDTFDMFSPAYDTPQKVKWVASYFNMNEFDLTFAGIQKFNNNSVAYVRAKRKCAA